MKQVDDFQKQFAKREMIETAGGVAEVVDVASDHLKDAVPVLFAPAWACTVPVYETAIKTLAKER